MHAVNKKKKKLNQYYANSLLRNRIRLEISDETGVAGNFTFLKKCTISSSFLPNSCGQKENLRKGKFHLRLKYFYK